MSESSTVLSAITFASPALLAGAAAAPALLAGAAEAAEGDASLSFEPELEDDCDAPSSPDDDDDAEPRAARAPHTCSVALLLSRAHRLD